MNKKNILKASFLLLAGLLLTFLITFRVQRHSEAQAKADYLDVCSEIALKIKNNVQDHAQFVRSASSFVESADTVTSRNWKIFETQSDFTVELPGEQPLGYSVIIPGNQLRSHIQKIREEGYPDYAINPKGNRPFYTSVIFVEPFLEGNLDVFGFDMFSEPIRRKAMEIARDSDKVMLTGKLILEPNANTDPHVGVLMYAPVYCDGCPSETVAQRRAAIRGWTFSVYRIDDLIQGILKRWDLNNEQHINLQIFDDRITDLSKLYDSQLKEKTDSIESPPRIVSIPIEVNGRKWILNFEQSGEPVSQLSNLELVTVISGFVISILISLLFFSLMRTSSEAKKIARNLMKELHEYSSRLSATLEAGNMAWWEIDSATGNVVFDKRKTEMIGYPPEKFSHFTDFTNLLHPDDHGKAMNAMRQHLKGDADKFDVEYRILTQSGEYKWCHDIGAVTEKDPAGKPLKVTGLVLDIDERKLKNEALKESEQRYQSLVEWSHFAALVHRDMKIIYVNPAAVKLFGASSEQDLVGSPVMRWHHPDYHQIVRERIRKANEEGVAAPMIVSKYLKLDGTEMELEVQGRPIIYNGLPAIFASFNDITEHRRIENEMIQVQSRFRSMIANISDVIAIIDFEGIIKYQSPNIEKWFGWLPEECVGSSNFLFIHPDDITMVQKKFNTLLNNKGSVFSFEYRYKCKDGSYKPVELTANSLLNDQSINGILVNYRDITARKRIYEELRESEKRYRLLIETASEGIFIAQGGRLKFVNPVVLDFFGYSKEEIMSIPFLDLVDPEDREYIRNNHLKRLKGEPVESGYHFKILRKDKSIKWIAINAVKIDWEGEPATLNLISDITERKEAEFEIRLKNEELQKLNSERDKFFSIIAHDLRGPLGGFMGLTQMMTDESQHFTEAEKNEISLELSRSARNTFNLLENLLEWSQTNRGEIFFNPQKLDLTEVITECINLVIEQARGKNISLTYDNPTTQKIFADKNMVQTVIRNLISNAIKFTAEGGKITISSEVAENNMTVIAVKDSGIGMTDEMRNNLFRRDSSTNRPGTKGEKSTGLGLLLCKEFVERQGGKIWVESELLNGSVFYFTIPGVGLSEAKNKNETVVLKEDQQRQLRKLKILIAEDDDISAKLISVTIKGISHQIIRVKTGSDAVETCRNNPDIDLVLMDIAMPVMDGYEATNQIRRFNKEVIIVAQTTFALKGDKEKAIIEGCNDYIQKPFGQDELIKIIRWNFLH